MRVVHQDNLLLACRRADKCWKGIHFWFVVALAQLQTEWPGTSEYPSFNEEGLKKLWGYHSDRPSVTRAAVTLEDGNILGTRVMVMRTGMTSMVNFRT
jgi:hypothetical protein